MGTKKKLSSLTLCVGLIMGLVAADGSSIALAAETPKQEAVRKLGELNALITQAKGSGIHTTREESAGMDGR